MTQPSVAANLLDRLEQLYPEAHCALIHDSAWQLLIATILSAQCTDKRVNMVTRELFKQFPDPLSLAAAELGEIEEAIRSTGFYRNKAKHLICCSQALLAQHNGEVPNRLEDLIKLPGVGRKTANVVLGNIFDIPGMVVDTHVKRLSRRFGWTTQNDPIHIEQELMKLLPASRWTQCGHTLIDHGRACCRAPIPHCSLCQVADICPRCGVDKSH